METLALNSSLLLTVLVRFLFLIKFSFKTFIIWSFTVWVLLYLNKTERVAPTGLQVTFINSTAISFSYDLTNGSNEFILTATDVDSVSAPIEIRSSEDRATFGTLNPSTNYSFVVRGVFESGEGPNSDAVFATTGNVFLYTWRKTFL